MQGEEQSMVRTQQGTSEQRQENILPNERRPEACRTHGTLLEPGEATGQTVYADACNLPVERYTVI